MCTSNCKAKYLPKKSNSLFIKKDYIVCKCYWPDIYAEVYKCICRTVRLVPSQFVLKVRRLVVGELFFQAETNSIFNLFRVQRPLSRGSILHQGLTT